jgi:hypothetical protein
MKDIKRALYEAAGKNAKSLVEEQASFFEELALSSEGFPEYCVDVVVEVLSVRELHEKPGIDKFILNTSTDSHRLSDDQKHRLLEAAANHYHEYMNQDFCWLLCDFIARSFNQESALIFFDGVFDRAHKEGRQGVALGLDILARSAKLEPNLMRRIEVILRRGANAPKSQ